MTFRSGALENGDRDRRLLERRAGRRRSRPARFSALATWRGPASPRSCPTSSNTCPSPVAPIGWPLNSRPPEGLNGMRPPIRVSPRSAAGPPRPTGKTEQLALKDFAERGRVMTFDDIDVLGTQPGGFIGAPGRLAGDVTFHPVGVAMVARHQHAMRGCVRRVTERQASPRTRGSRRARPPRHR